MQISFKSQALAVDGFLGIGPYQGQQATSGYRLLYVPQPARGDHRFELVKRSWRGDVKTIGYSDLAVNLQDGNSHALQWTRDKTGLMRLLIDGQKIIEVRDASFRDPFNGLAIVNRGGDYGIVDVVIKVP